MFFFKENIFKNEDLFKIKHIKKNKDDMRLLLKGLKKAGKINKIKEKNRIFPSSIHAIIKNKIDRSQQCMIKLRYGNDKQGHRNFLKTYMRQENKNFILEKPEYFGDELASYEANLTKKHFKFIISPENQNIDLKLLTNTLIMKMNKIYNVDLRYIAVIHEDTGHRHVHLLINGKDKKGRYINKFGKEFVKHTMRNLSRNICTKLVGERTLEEIYHQSHKTYSKNRVTYLDKGLKNFLIKNYKSNEFPWSINSQIINEQFRRRLNYLIELGLAKKNNKDYLLSDDWFETLKAMGRYNTFLEIRALYAVKNKKIEVFNKQERIEAARVLKIYNMDDEDVWSNACVVETDKKILFVPTYTKIDKQILNKIVSIEKNEKDNAKNIRVLSNALYNSNIDKL